MDIVNFDALKAQDRIIDPSQVDPNEDYFLIGKYTNHYRTNSMKATNYPIYAIKAGDVINTLPAYKVYSAILNQSGGSDPVPIVLENTLSGAITWARSLAGNYTGTLTGEFTLDKTMIFINGYNATGSAVQYETIAVLSDVNTVEVGTYKLTEQDAAGNLLKTTLDGVLYNASIEIRVYN